jgi:hypothetical protein
MNLKELINNIKIIESLFPSYQNMEDVNVVITTSESSIGGRAFTEVRNIFEGFDWERNQLRIEPIDKLLKQPIRDTAEIIKQSLSGISFSGCSYCGRKVSREDYYCRQCGRKFLR